jgi:hypothetical protein
MDGSASRIGSLGRSRAGQLLTGTMGSRSLLYKSLRRFFAVLGLGVAGLPMHALGAPPSDRAGLAWVGRFESDLGPWREIRLKSGQSPNSYRLIDWDGARAVEVSSMSSMSLLARPANIDLISTPVLCWRWRVDASLSRADMTQRDGDDYAARVYISFRLPPASLGFALRAQLVLARALWGQDLPDAAINYVWDNRQPVGTTRPNAYTDRVQMVVLRSGDAEAGRWIWERVDVQRDAMRLFGPDVQPIQLAITADTDNTGSTARSGFADLHFVAADRPCSQ